MSIEGLRALHNYLDIASARAAQIISQEQESSRRLLEEFVEKQCAVGKNERLVLQFCQFLVGTMNLTDAYYRHELTEMGDWLGWIFCEEIKDTHEISMHYGRLTEFMGFAPIYSWPSFDLFLARFFSGFYHYARERTALKEIAEDLWGVATITFNMVLSKNPAMEIHWSEVGTELLCWAGKEAPRLLSEISPQIERLALDEETPKVTRAMFHMAMSTSAGRQSNLHPSVWAEKTITEYSDIVSGGHKIQLLSTIFANSSEFNGAELISEINNEQFKRRKRMPEIQFMRDASIRYGALQPFVVECLRRNNVTMLLEGFDSWYQLENGKDIVDADDLLVVIPFGESGMLSVLKGDKVELIRESQALLEKMVSTNNRFLGTAKTVAYADNSRVKIPERAGVPSYGEVVELEQILKECYCPTSFPHPSEPLSQIILDTECNPVQAIQLSAWGRTWPICVSLSKPKPDRKITKVLIWSGGETMTEQHEVEVVKYIFETSGALVDLVLSESCTAEDFAIKYRDESYDVVWVISHGLYDHWRPQKMTVQVAYDRAEASLEDIWGIAPETEERRLFFLNICDGARHEERGALPKIGLAVGTACSSQATISHLWPVMGYPATIFGIYLAYFLCNGFGYFYAFQESIKSLRRSAPEIHVDLKERIGGNFAIYERLSFLHDDFSIIECSGSMAFYQ